MEANRPSTNHTAHTAPRDIACVSIDTSAYLLYILLDAFGAGGDPYCYTDSGIVVKLAYSNTDVSLQDRLRAYACSLS